MTESTRPDALIYVKGRPLLEIAADFVRPVPLAFRNNTGPAGVAMPRRSCADGTVEGGSRAPIRQVALGAVTDWLAASAVASASAGAGVNALSVTNEAAIPPCDPTGTRLAKLTARALGAQRSFEISGHCLLMSGKGAAEATISAPCDRGRRHDRYTTTMGRAYPNCGFRDDDVVPCA